jgi:hypothetical protein
MGFKNHIRHMAAVVGNTLLKTFPDVHRCSPVQPMKGPENDRGYPTA